MFQAFVSLPTAFFLLPTASPFNQQHFFDKMADAAKNALSSIFDKTKDVLSTAADATKGYASQAQQAIGKIIPGANHESDPNAAVAAAQAASGQPVDTTGGVPPAQ